MKSLGSTTIGILEPEIAAMEEVSQFKDLQESQQKLEQLLQSESMKQTTSKMKIQDQISGIDKKYEHIIHTLAEIQLQLLNISKGSSENSVLEGFASPHGAHKSGSSLNYTQGSRPRIDFPRFDGSHPRIWILKCNNYFKVMPSLSDAQRINLAIMHFDGRAFSWIQNLNMGEIGITWEQFFEVICARFEDVRVSKIFMECNKLKQNGSYDDYVEKFEELRACMVLHDSSKYYEDSFVASFLSGLSEDVQAFINIFQPTNLEHTIELGRKHQLITLDAISKKLQPYDAKEELFDAQKAMEFGIPEVESNMVQTVKEVRQFWKLINAKEVADLGNPNTGEDLVQNVDEVPIDEIFILQDTNKKGDIPPDLIPILEEYAAIFEEQVGMPPARGVKHPKFSEEDRFTTVRRVGTVENHQLNILLDTENIPSFIQEIIAHKFRCVFQDDETVPVRVANEHESINIKKAIDFEWTLQGHELPYYHRLLNIEDFMHQQTKEIEVTAVLKAEIERVKLLTIIVEGMGNTRPVLTSLTHELITNFQDILVEEVDAVLVKSTPMLGFLTRRYSDIPTTHEVMAEKQFGVGDMISLKFHPLHQHPFYLNIGKEIIPMVKYFEDGAANGRTTKVLQSFTTRIQSGLEFVVEAAAAYIFCKRGKSVQKLLEVDVDRNFKIQFLLALHTHRVTRTSQEIPQILLQCVDTRPQCVATHPRITRPIEEFYLCLVHCPRILILYSIQEHEEFQIFVQRMGLPETDSDESFKIESLLVLGTHIHTQKGKNFAQILVHWLTATPGSATGKVESCLSRKFSTFDPWGQGSSSGGGIVMAQVGVNGGGDGMEEKGWAPPRRSSIWGGLNWKRELLKMKFGP